MKDEIIEEVERVREEIARRHDYDIDRIFQAAKERSAKRKKGKQEKELSERKAEGSAS
jgi:hypothetical protein